MKPKLNKFETKINLYLNGNQNRVNLKPKLTEFETKID